MKLAIMASGRGSNAAAILGAVDRGDLHAHVTAIISNRTDAGVIDLAAQHGIPSHVVSRKDFDSRNAQQRRMLELLQMTHTDFVALAGFNSILKPEIVTAYPNQILNIHPSLLPAFAGGMAPQPQTEALKAGVKISGCTVHLVTNAIDAGPIVAQAPVPVLPDDTVDSLSKRILQQEHRLYPMVLQWFADGQTQISDGQVHVRSEENQVIWPKSEH
ncbi:MAG: phosphoribosylglycinamide formyltransferase [Chloroflexi bacterium]|nr:phosphoribosylglycinamide formyltransferase [Chloroflexota bacterium]HCU74079.1 phosphoribosylglycinamide formyltransferase [Chloroflexota bacterium]|tara:strand:+ start:577 stop:1224 length:648 start_codon:yes stop_codon:yes gene_type:complete